MSDFRRVIVDWSYPIDMKRVLYDARMDDIGLYYITREFGGKVSDLYIGKTTYSFKSRLESHLWNWLDQYRGIKKVRLGYLVFPKTIAEAEKKRLINDTEATLILLKGQSLIHNQKGIYTCNPSCRLHITNIGYRGNLDVEMYIPDENWLE